MPNAEKTKKSTRKKMKMPELDKYLEKNGRWTNYERGAYLYDMSPWNFRKLAKAANATKRIRRIMFVDLIVLETYLEEFNDWKEFDNYAR